MLATGKRQQVAEQERNACGPSGWRRAVTAIALAQVELQGFRPKTSRSPPDRRLQEAEAALREALKEKDLLQRKLARQKSSREQEAGALQARHTSV